VNINNNQASKKDVFNAIWDSILRLFGEYGASKTDLRLIDYDLENKRAILRCSHEALPLVKASIPCITRIGGRPAAAHIELVSGTLKSLRKKLLYMQKDQKNALKRED